MRIPSAPLSFASLTLPGPTHSRERDRPAGVTRTDGRRAARRGCAGCGPWRSTCGHRLRRPRAGPQPWGDRRRRGTGGRTARRRGRYCARGRAAPASPAAGAGVARHTMRFPPWLVASIVTPGNHAPDGYGLHAGDACVRRDGHHGRVVRLPRSGFVQRGFRQPGRLCGPSIAFQAIGCHAARPP